MELMGIAVGLSIQWMQVNIIYWVFIIPVIEIVQMFLHIVLLQRYNLLWMLFHAISNNIIWSKIILPVRLSICRRCGETPYLLSECLMLLMNHEGNQSFSIVQVEIIFIVVALLKKTKRHFICCTRCLFFYTESSSLQHYVDIHHLLLFVHCSITGDISLSPVF